MIKYAIIVGFTLADLQDEVSRAIEHDYTPQGGVAVAPENSSIAQSYIQAMVKEE